MGELAYRAMQEMAESIIAAGDRVAARHALSHCIKFGQDCQAAIAMLSTHLGVAVVNPNKNLTQFEQAERLAETRDHVEVPE